MWMAMEVSTFSVLAALAVVGVSWPIASAIYSLYFDPLARFPGPTAAGLTRWWKAWIECVRGSSFCHELEKQHARYGPVVRIGPNEVSIHSSSTLFQIVLIPFFSCISLIPEHTTISTTTRTVGTRRSDFTIALGRIAPRSAS
jgi:hypothetical protein